MVKTCHRWCKGCAKDLVFVVVCAMRLAPAECEDGLCSPIKTQNMLKTWRSSAAKDKLSPRTALFTGWLLLSLPAALFTEQAQRTPDPQAQNGADLRSVCYFPLMSSTSQENASNPLLLPHLKVASLFPDHGHFAFLLSSVPKTKTRGNNWRSRNIKHRIHHAHTTSAE